MACGARHDEDAHRLRNIVVGLGEGPMDCWKHFLTLWKTIVRSRMRVSDITRSIPKKRPEIQNCSVHKFEKWQRMFRKYDESCDE